MWDLNKLILGDLGWEVGIICKEHQDIEELPRYPIRVGDLWFSHTKCLKIKYVNILKDSTFFLY